MVRALLRLALDHAEDAHWVSEGEARLATFDRSKALTHEQVWGPAADSGRSPSTPLGVNKLLPDG
jgi:hypothetical protein